jgi:hypothetical protein
VFSKVPPRALSAAEKTVIIRETVVSKPLINFEEFHPYRVVPASWSDCPELPQIATFASMSEFVDYVYRLVPKLQTHLSAIHGKVVEMDKAMEDKISRDLVEKMFDGFQGIVAGLTRGLDGFKLALERTATRTEVNEIIRNVFHPHNPETETSIGCLRCMACGREIERVTDTAPSPLTGALCQSRESFHSILAENPYPTRPLRQVPLRPKLAIPSNFT